MEGVQQLIAGVCIAPQNAQPAKASSLTGREAGKNAIVAEKKILTEESREASGSQPPRFAPWQWRKSVIAPAIELESRR
jgi:hypothetical protein